MLDESPPILSQATMTYLIPATDNHFAWLMAEAPPPDGLSEPAGGVESPTILKLLRRLTATLHAANCRASWLIVSEKKIVGLCSFKRPPDVTGSAEIGYGIAPSCRRQGHATAAIALLSAKADQDPTLTILRGETSHANLPSQRVLQKNGFSKAGTRQDPEDGDLILWSRPTSPQTQ